MNFVRHLDRCERSEHEAIKEERQAKDLRGEEYPTKLEGVISDR